MLTRRALLTGLALTLVPRAARAQTPAPPRIGWLSASATSHSA